MPNNIILTPSVYVKGVLMNLGGYLAVCRNMSKEYSKEFGKANAKVLRYPQRKAHFGGSPR